MTTTARDRIGKLLGGVGASSSFSGRRTVAAGDLDLQIEGFGRLQLPVSRAQAERLCRIARPARYGRGEETLLDRRVRDTWEIPKSRIEIDRDQWRRTLRPALDELRADLGLPEGCRLAPELHSMLVYAPGQFFLPHRDSEKSDEMIATLVVTLPGSFTGGALVVEHRGEKAAYRGTKKTLSLVAFYADCLHEVQPVQSGYRVVLTYNLLLEGEAAEATEATAATMPATVDALATRLREHFETPLPPPRYAREGAPEREPPSRLVYLLDHQYTERGFRWQRLKGSDAARAAVLAAAAGHADCETVLALAESQETWDCFEPGFDEPRYGRHRYWERDLDEDEWSANEPPPPPRDDPDAYTLGDLIDSSIVLERWVDLSGGRAAPTASLVEREEVAATTPSVELEPYEASYEGFMGNYGNTMDRWYRRAAVMVWPRERAFAVRAEADPAWALEEIQRRLKAGDTDDARERAASVLPFWASVASHDERRGVYAKALRVARDLDEPSLATPLLEPFRVEALTPARAAAWAALCERYGEAWMRALLTAWSSSRHGWIGRERQERMRWIASLPRLCDALCTVGVAAGAPAARLLLEDAWRRLRDTIVEKQDLAPPSLRDKALAALPAPILGVLDGAAAAGAKALGDEAVAFLSASENDPLVPSLVKALRAAAKAPKRTARAAPALDALAQHSTERLEARLERPARDEDDWSIALPAGCHCELCATLADFLADPEATELEWPLNKERRMHVHRRIDAHELPVRHQTRRTGSPYTLVLTKTEALFEREARERRAWSKDLEWLQRKAAGGAGRRAERVRIRVSARTKR